MKIKRPKAIGGHRKSIQIISHRARTSKILGLALTVHVLDKFRPDLGSYMRLGRSQSDDFGSFIYSVMLPLCELL
jgi:hypothetical protein